MKDSFSKSMRGDSGNAGLKNPGSAGLGDGGTKIISRDDGALIRGPGGGGGGGGVTSITDPTKPSPL